MTTPQGVFFVPRIPLTCRLSLDIPQRARPCRHKRKEWALMDQQRNTGVVYCITNQLNGKQYVGITGRSLQQRFAEHCKADSYIGKAIRKHGVENFMIKEIDEAETKQDLREKEMMWIEKLGTFGRGYNLTIGGDGVSTLQKLNLELTDKQSKFLRFVE